MPGCFAVFALSMLMVAPSSVLVTRASGAAPSKAELCFGQVPTIVGTPGDPSGPPIEGTEGVDVVVTNGASGAILLGGNDLLCITGEPPYVSGEHPPTHNMGEGNDRIDSSERTDTSGIAFVTWLGPGSDEFIGGVTPDSVLASDMSDQDTDADVIHAGGGDDSVSSGGPDMVGLGPDRDSLVLTQDPSGGLYSGGLGVDSLNLYVRHAGAHAWKLDNRSDRLKRDGEQVGVFASFVHFGGLVRGSLVFVGADSDETFTAGGGPVPPKGSLVVRMNGGDDYVEVFAGTPGDRFDGGLGRDEFAYASTRDKHTSIVLNLASGLLRNTSPQAKMNRQALNFERAVVDNLSRSRPGSTTIKGTNGANWLKAWGPGPITIYGRAGDDELVAYAPGVLKGGRGHDIARAGHGAEVRCEAEVTFGC
jgi:hypothetical protein